MDIKKLCSLGSRLAFGSAVLALNLGTGCECECRPLYYDAIENMAQCDPETAALWEEVEYLESGMQCDHENDTDGPYQMMMVCFEGCAEAPPSVCADVQRYRDHYAECMDQCTYEVAIWDAEEGDAWREGHDLIHTGPSDRY